MMLSLHFMVNVGYGEIPITRANRRRGNVGLNVEYVHDTPIAEII